MATIRRKFAGKTDHQIYEKVHEFMQGVAAELSLDYQTDTTRRSGKVAKMGVTGSYTVAGGEVAVELSYPMLLPGAMRKKVEAKIEKKLESLFA